MTFPRWDRIYLFAFSATAFAVLAYLAMLFVPLVEVVTVTNVETTPIEVVSRRTLLADGQLTSLLLSLVPVVLTAGTLLAIPRDAQPTRSGKINLWLSTFLVYAFVVISIYVVGLLFVPSAILMTAAAVGSQVRRRGRRQRPPQESMSGRGGGKRRRNKD
jgi:hypothetical protein